MQSLQCRVLSVVRQSWNVRRHHHWPGHHRARQEAQSQARNHQRLPCRQHDWSLAFPAHWLLKHSKIWQMCGPRVEYSPSPHQHQDNHCCNSLFLCYQDCKISQFPWSKVCYHFNIKHNIPMFIQMHLFHFVSVLRYLCWEERDEWYLRKCSLSCPRLIPILTLTYRKYHIYLYLYCIRDYIFVCYAAEHHSRPNWRCLSVVSCRVAVMPSSSSSSQHVSTLLCLSVREPRRGQVECVVSPSS